MNKFTTSLATFAALLAGGLVAVPTPAQATGKPAVKHPGVLHVYDGGSMFTKSGVEKAKGTMGNVQFDHGLSLTIDTHSTVAKDKTAPAKDASDGEKEKFFKAWAKELAVGDHAKGIYVLVCRSPGYVEVIADKETRDRGFAQSHEQHLRKLFLDAFNTSKDKSDDEKFRLRDEALLAATNYVINDLKDTVVAGTGTTGTTSTNNQVAKKTGMSIGGWICIGLCVLLGVWLVIGLLRALTGGGGGGYGGGGGGYGGGGGGFGMGLMGGLFGAMAGMWLYNSMMGTHYGSDAYAGGDNSSNTDAGGGDTGAGDFSDDAGAGGGFDDGGSGGDTGGGGDYGGGGGGDDYGGGGDFGGGGGGGGDGDFGGDF